MARVALVGVDATMCTVSAAPGFLAVEYQYKLQLSTLSLPTGACCTTMFLILRSSTSMFFASALDSAFFNKRVMNLIDFSGQRPVLNELLEFRILIYHLNTPCVALNSLACADRPTPPENRLKGIIRLWSLTSER